MNKPLLETKNAFNIFLVLQHFGRGSRKKQISFLWKFQTIWKKFKIFCCLCWKLKLVYSFTFSEFYDAMADPNLFLWIKLLVFQLLAFSGVTTASKLASEICLVLHQTPFLAQPGLWPAVSGLEDHGTDCWAMAHFLSFKILNKANWPQTSQDLSWIVWAFTQNLQSFHGGFLLSVLSQKKKTTQILIGTETRGWQTVIL